MRHEIRAPLRAARLAIALALGLLSSAAFSQVTNHPATNPPALYNIKQAAERGEMEAQFRLGNEYETQGDFPKAVEWYGKAARRGHAAAQYELGQMLWVRNLPDAVRWLKAAAEQDHPRAQLTLGRTCRDGRLVPPDPIEAYKWLALAATHGLTEAATERDALILALSADQVVEGQRRVNALLVRKSEATPKPEDHAVLALKGLSLGKKSAFALINDQTFAAGEERVVQVGLQKIKLRCLEIRTNSVLISIAGVPTPQELKLR